MTGSKSPVCNACSREPSTVRECQHTQSADAHPPGITRPSAADPARPVTAAGSSGLFSAAMRPIGTCASSQELMRHGLMGTGQAYRTQHGRTSGQGGVQACACYKIALNDHLFSPPSWPSPLQSTSCGPPLRAAPAAASWSAAATKRSAECRSRHAAQSALVGGQGSIGCHTHTILCGLPGRRYAPSGTVRFASCNCA